MQAWWAACGRSSVRSTAMAIPREYTGHKQTSVTRSCSMGSASSGSAVLFVISFDGEERRAGAIVDKPCR